MAISYQYDVLIIGSGAAGLTLALHLPPEIKIAILSKGDLKSGSTWLAQGGIAAVLGFLGQHTGLYHASQAISKASAISPSLVALAFRVREVD